MLIFHVLNHDDIRVLSELNINCKHILVLVLHRFLIVLRKRGLEFSDETKSDEYLYLNYSKLLCAKKTKKNLPQGSHKTICLQL